MNKDIEDGLIIVSLKTKSEKDMHSDYSSRSRSFSPSSSSSSLRREKARMNMPKCIFGSGDIEDTEETRYQLQLMMESIIMTDTYGAKISDAFIMYIYEKNMGSDCTKSVGVKVENKEEWWWSKIFESKNKRHIFDMIYEHVYNYLS